MADKFLALYLDDPQISDHPREFSVIGVC